MASGHIHSPEGKQSIAVACNSRNKGSTASFLKSSTNTNQEFSFPAETKVIYRSLILKQKSIHMIDQNPAFLAKA